MGRTSGKPPKPATGATGQYAKAAPVAKVTRAREWTPEIEDLWRLQFCGWRDVPEYESVHGSPERWPCDSNEYGAPFISKLVTKESGHFTYWRRWRQCEDRQLFQVKVYS